MLHPHRTTPHRTSHGTPHGTPHCTPHYTPHRTPHYTPRYTPHYTPVAVHPSHHTPQVRGLSNPRGIAVDGVDGKLYVLEQNSLRGFNYENFNGKAIE